MFFPDSRCAKRIACSFWILLLGSSPLAPVTATEAAVPLEHVRIAIPALPRTVIPAKLVDNISFSIAQYLHEPLFRFDNENGFSSNILRTWRMSEDGKTYSFSLKPKLTFHNGMRLTVADVVFSLQECRKAKACALSYVPYDMRFVADSSTDFRIILTHASSILLYTLSDRKASIVPARFGMQNEDQYALAPVGAGPYKLAKRSNAELLLERFDAYSGLRPENGHISFILVDNVEQLTAEHRRQRFHDINQLVPVFPADKLNAFVHTMHFREVRFPFLNTNVVFMNFKKALFNNPHLRRFLFTLFRQPEMVDAASPTGTGEKATGFISKGMLGHLALEDMMRAGQRDLTDLYVRVKRPPRVQLSLISCLDPKRVQRFQQLLDARMKPFPNIRITVLSLPKKNFYDQLFSGRYELALAMWLADYTHPFFYIETFKSGNEYNFGHISDKDIDKALSSFNGTTKESVHEFCKNVDLQAMNKHLLIPISYSTGIYYFPTDLVDYDLSVMGPAMFDHSRTKTKSQ